MKKFLVLTKDIINVKYIHNIVIKDNKYIINLLSNNNFTGFIIYGSGYISNNNDEPIIIEKNDDDYKKITEFIESI
jgi:hypothetical protein